MTTSDPNNQLDQTNEYLEFLAGHREKEPQLDPADEEISKATRLLGAMREHDPRPVFVPKIKHAVLATSQHIPKTPPVQPHPYTMLWLWKVSTPIVATALVVVAIMVTRAVPATNHAGTNFKKTQLTADQAAVVDLAATREDALGVDAATAFQLKVKSGTITLADVQKNFALSPTTKFSVQVIDPSTYEITPEAPLATGRVYAATYQATPTDVDGQVQTRTYSWAYQVRNTFGIIGLLPRDRATGVSLNTGVEVTFSSSGVSAEEFKKNLTIAPAVDGRVEVHERTLVFIPTKPLAEKTVYTVTVKKDVKATGATAELGADETWQFETTAKNSKDAEAIYSRFFPSKLFDSIRPNEPIIFSNNSYDSSAKPSTTQFTVYKYPDFAAFTKAVTTQESSRTPWATFSSQGTTYDNEGLTKVGVYKTKTANGLATLGPGWAAGYYLADGGTGNTRAQLPFVVSDIGTYSITTKTDSLIWVNDLATKKPVVGATVVVPGATGSIKTDAQGIARFSTPLTTITGGAPSLVATVRDGSRETPVLLNGSPYYYFGSQPFGNIYSDYWTYLSTDRNLYQPNDTVQFWGLLRHRDQPRVSTSITARLVQQSFETRYEPEIIATTTITANSTGTFLGSLALNGAKPNGSTYLEIQVDGVTVVNRYLNIETYRKPPYKITVQPNHQAAIAGEKVTYTITSQFFDGTPVPNLALKESYNSDNATLVTTNAQGQATYARTMTTQNGFFSLTPTDGQTEGLTGDAYVHVFPAGFEMTVNTTVADTTGTLTGTVNQILPDNAQAGAADPLAGVHGPVQPNQTIEGKLIEIVYEKTQVGTHYDYLLKESVPDYQYNSRDETRETFQLTSDAAGAFERTFTLKAESVYRVELTTLDSKKRTATATGYFWHSLYNNLYDRAQYSLTNVDSRDGAEAPAYPIGATVNLQVQSNGAVATVPTDGKILYLFNQRGLRRYTITTSPSETFTFGESDVPSLGTRAVIFNGVGYAEMMGPTIQFDRDSRKLNITVTPDKPRYAPGDQVRLAIKATDNNGRGQTAHINLKAIDEAFLALDQFSDGSDNPSAIYSQVDDGVLGTYVSHEAVTSRDLAEGGGGGGDRTDFKDTAVFTEITTDTQGNGTLTFTLPDNLTSWRVTAQGFTDGLFAGKTQTSLTVAKDIFVTVAVEPDQLSRDRATILAGTYGVGLNSDDGVAYTFSLVDVPGSVTTLSAKAFATVRFAMPEVTPGTYRVRVEAKAKNSSDVVVMPVIVSASRLQRQTAKTVMLPSLVPIPYGLDSRTIFRFDDADRNLAYATLWGLVGATYNRLDDVVADQIARRTLNLKFQQTIGGDPADPMRYLTGRGAALYAVGSENLESGALAASDPSLTPGRQQLLDWFRGVLDDPKQNTEQVAHALYGLAQLGQPVLPDIRAVLKLPDLSDRDRLTLLLALETLGAKEESRPAALLLLQKYGESQDQYFRLNLGESDDAKIVSSARFAILAAGLGLDQRYGLLRYLQNYPPRDTRTTLEQALATERLLALAPTTPATVTYELEGKTSTATLTAEKPLIISATTDQAKTLKISGNTGNVSIVSTYQEAFDITKAARNPRLTLTRTYLVNNKKTTTFNAGDLVKVQFTWTKKSDAFGKSFGVTDLLPTGLRPVSNPWMYDWSSKTTAPYAIAGQRTQLYAGSNGSTFYYLARATAPGRAVAEPAILQAFDSPTSIQYSSEAVIEIK